MSGPTLRSVLCVREAEGAGDPQHRVDRRVHLAGPAQPHEPIHQHLLMRMYCASKSFRILEAV